MEEEYEEPAPVEVFNTPVLETIDTVEFYPPEGYNSAELGFLYRGYSKGMDIISLLIL